MENIPWTSKTGKVGDNELEALQKYDIESLVNYLSGFSSLANLRMLTEIMHHGDLDKLNALLTNPKVGNWWKNYTSDPGRDGFDPDYANELEFHQHAAMRTKTEAEQTAMFRKIMFAAVTILFCVVVVLILFQAFLK